MTEETKDIRLTPDEIVLKPQEWLSPSSINTYYKCNRSYFYTYVAKLFTKPNIHLVKGSIVHKVLEDFFKGYNENLETHILGLFEKTWDANEKVLKSLELKYDELIMEKEDAKRMVIEYYLSFKRKLDSYVMIGKAENDQHAFFLLRPKFREVYVTNERLHCRGYIDRVNKDFDGVVTLGDYKTSNKYGIGLPEDYKRQLAIYGLMYKEQEKLSPDYVAIVFLRFGEEYILEVTPSLLRYALDSINDCYSKTRTVNIEDYPKKESPLCKWCQFQNECSGLTNWEDSYREQVLRKALKLEEKKVEELQEKA